MGKKLFFIVLTLFLVLAATVAVAQKKDQVVIWERLMYDGDPAWMEAYKSTFDGMMDAIGRPAEVAIDLMPWTGNDAKWQAAFLAGEPPDVGRHLYGGMDKLLAEGLMVPTEDWLTDAEKANLGEIAIKSMTQPDGHMYGWPTTHFGPTSWAINADLVKAAGYNPQDIMTKGWTYDDVIAIAKKTTKPASPITKGVWGFGNAGENVWRMGYLIYQSRGPSGIETLGEGMLNPQGEFAANDKGYLDAFQFYYDLMYKYNFWPKDMLGMKMAEVEQMFFDGKIAIIDQGSGILDKVTRNNAAILAGTAKGTIVNALPVILPRPSYQKKHVGRLYAGPELYVFRQKVDKGAEHLANVKAAFRLLMGPIGQSRMAMFGWVTPGFKWTQDAYRALLDPSKPKNTLDMFFQAIAVPPAPWPKLTDDQSTAYGKMETIANDLGVQMMANKITPKQRLQKLNEEAKKLGFKIAETSVVD